MANDEAFRRMYTEEGFLLHSAGSKVKLQRAVDRGAFELSRRRDRSSAIRKWPHSGRGATWFLVVNRPPEVSTSS